MVIDSTKVGGNRVDDDEPTVSEAGGCLLDEDDVGAQVRQDLSAIFEDDGLENPDLFEIRTGGLEPRNNGPGRVVFRAHQDDTSWLCQSAIKGQRSTSGDGGGQGSRDERLAQLRITGKQGHHSER